MLGLRIWFCLRFLYRRATKNIAAPYAAAPQTTPRPMPILLALTGDELPMPGPTGAAPVVVADDDGESPVLDPGSSALSARIGMALFTMLRRVRTLASGWL